MFGEDKSADIERVSQMEKQISDLQEEINRLSHLAETNKECSVCMEDRETTDFKILNPCGHRFCQTCIANLNNKLCPYCRTSFTSTVPYFTKNSQ